METNIIDKRIFLVKILIVVLPLGKYIVSDLRDYYRCLLKYVIIKHCKPVNDFVLFKY